MSPKNWALAALLCALLAHVAEAVGPTITVVPAGQTGGNRDWLVKVAPDPTLFTNPADNPDRGLGGSMAIEMAFSIDDPVDLLTVAIADPVAWPLDTVGNNPFTGTVTDGIYIDLAGDRSFTAYGSNFLTSGNATNFLKITTAGLGLTTLRWGTAASGNANKGNLIAQGGQIYQPYSGVVSVPEPASAVIAVTALVAIFAAARRRESTAL